MKTLAKLSAAFGLLTLTAGCPPTAPAADMVDEDQDLRRPPGDMGADLRTSCALGGDFRPIDQVSDGVVTIMSMPGPTYSAVIDASAGGTAAAPSRPYLYLDLASAKKVDITDVQARESKAWDIALKRSTIKINSGDSGTGGVTEAVIEGKELEGVTAAPASGYVADQYFDADCMPKRDAIGGLQTAMSDWYDYNVNTHVLTAWKNTYVLKRRDGMGTIKLQIMNYYSDPMSPMRGGIYTIRWGFLP